MTCTIMADYAYDFSAFNEFFESSAVQNADSSQADFEAICSKLDVLFRSGGCQLPFMEIYFYMSFSRRQRPARMHRFSYLGTSYVEETLMDHAHLHEVYYVGKFYSQCEKTRAALTEHLQSVDLRCSASLFGIMNMDSISDFFHIGHEKIDYLKALTYMKLSATEMPSLCQHVRRLTANYLGCKFIFHSIYYISRNMYTNKRDFYGDFLERKVFAEYVSRRFLLLNIFELNYHIIYNFNRYPDLVESIYQSELKSNSLWVDSFATMFPGSTATFTTDTSPITPYLSPSLQSFQNLHKLLCDKVYSSFVKKEMDIALLLLNFKTYLYRAQFCMQYHSMPLWANFVGLLKEFDKDINYSFKFLSLNINHLRKYNDIAE